MFMLNCALCCLIASTAPMLPGQGDRKPASAKKGSGTANAAVPPKTGKLPNSGSLRIAVVDLDRVLENSKWVEWVKISAGRELNSLQLLITQKLAIHDALRDKLDLLVQGTVEFGTTFAEKEGLATEIRKLNSVHSLMRRNKSAESYVAIVQEIRQTVMRYAKQQGISLVLKEFSKRSMDSAVLFAAASLNITASIVELLDAAHPEDVAAAKAAKKEAEAKKAVVTKGKGSDGKGKN